MVHQEFFHRPVQPVRRRCLFLEGGFHRTREIRCNGPPEELFKRESFVPPTDTPARHASRRVPGTWPERCQEASSRVGSGGRLPIFFFHHRTEHTPARTRLRKTGRTRGMLHGRIRNGQSFRETLGGGGVDRTSCPSTAANQPAQSSTRNGFLEIVQRWSCPAGDLAFALAAPWLPHPIPLPLCLVLLIMFPSAFRAAVATGVPRRGVGNAFRRPRSSTSGEQTGDRSRPAPGYPRPSDGRME